MTVDLDNPMPEDADWARLLEAATRERNQLRSDLARVTAERDAATRTIAQLREMLERLNGYEASVVIGGYVAERDAARENLEFLRDHYTLFGGRRCPACLYEDGKFIRDCQLHQYVSAIAGRADDAEGTLASIASVMSCEPDDNADLVEAVRLLVKERDTTIRERDERVRSLEALERAARAWAKFGRDDSDDENDLLRAVDALASKEKP